MSEDGPKNFGRRSEDEFRAASERLITEIEELLGKLQTYYETKKTLGKRILGGEILHKDYSQNDRNIEVFERLLNEKIDKLENRGYIERAQIYNDRWIEMKPR